MTSGSGFSFFGLFGRANRSGADKSAQPSGNLKTARDPQAFVSGSLDSTPQGGGGLNNLNPTDPNLNSLASDPNGLAAPHHLDVTNQNQDSTSVNIGGN